MTDIPRKAQCAVPSDWPEQVIRCKNCGLPISRVDMSAPEGPTMQGMHGWTHTVGPLCPPYNIAPEGAPIDVRQFHAEASTHVSENIEHVRAVALADGQRPTGVLRATAPEEQTADDALRAIGELPPLPPAASPSAGAAPQNGWQLIETAPKDGRYMVLLEPRWGAVTGRWNAFDAPILTGETGFWEAYANPVRPTHWLPIPPIPSPPGRAGEEQP